MSRRPPNNMEPLPTDFALESPVTPASVTSKGVGSGPWLGGLSVTCEDCMALMARYADKHFDLAIVDPPYGIGAAEMTMGSGTNKQWTKKKWDTAIPPPEYFVELRRVSARQIIWGGNYFPLPCTRAWVFWDKGIDGESSFADGELAWTNFDRVLRKAPVRYKGFLGADNERIHPTQKPVALYDWLLRTYAVPGQRVLDTHLGSGSHAIAAHYFGAHLTACEIDADYYAAAMARINRETAQTTLFT